jgi:hypothetical protein
MMITNFPYFPDEIAERALNLYHERLEAQLEIPENTGRFLSLDIVTGDYILSEQHWEGSKQLKTLHPEAIIYTLRIGYPAAVSLSGRVRPLLDSGDTQ